MAVDFIHDSDDKLVEQALIMWQNWVATKNPLLSPGDLERQGKKVPTLTKDQMRLIIRLDDLINKVRK